jgi:ATP-dependent helicase/nuclease subunit A
MTHSQGWPNVMIRASAGTGKTYQLSNRYLQLAADEQAPEQILAATFARKAAGEILGRVLERLADAALDETRRRELALGIDRELSAADCRRLLRLLIGELHRLRIGTLDSFFVQLAGSFTLELGLPTGWQIVDEPEDRQLRLEAVRRVLDGGASGEISSLVNLVFKGEAARSVTDEIAGIVAALYGAYCDSPPAAWHGLARPPLLAPHELVAALDALAAARPTDGRCAKAWSADVERASRQDWEAFLETGLAKALSGDGLFYRKPIDDGLAALYAPLLRHARGALVGKLANQTEATYKLLAAYGEIYERLKIARRGLRFDDVPRLLADGLAGGLMEHAHWRLDASIGHLLLDEFQDTSLAQWNVLKPFAAACCQPPGHSFFCVGDVKQAIYRWRGGVSQLFDAAHSELAGVCEESLTTSYRSCPTIIETVNRVFSTLPANPTLVDYPEVADQWQGWFETHSTAKGQLAGFSTLQVAPRAGEGQKQNRTTLEFAAARIAELAAECPGRSLGVLVRRNEVVARLIYLLRSVHKLPASEEGGNPLTDSAAVQLILSLVTLADHPGDKVARFHVAESPLGCVVGFAGYTDDVAALALAARLRRQLMDAGYGRTIYGWVKSLAERCGPRDLDRLVQLTELGYTFEKRAGIRPQEFVDFVRETKVEDPAAANVRVMTIHQAKGLQFDMVVLPELDVPLKGQSPALAVGRPRPIDPIELVSRHANKTVVGLLPTEFQRMFEVWPREALSESLCMLYVALTRAVHALHMIVGPSRPNENKLPLTFAGVLRAGLAAGRAALPEMTLYEHGRRDWFEQHPFSANDSSPEGETAIPDDSPYGCASRPAESVVVRLRAGQAAPRELRRLSPSSLEGGGIDGARRVGLRDRLSSHSGEVFARGTLWHAWFEQIEWLDGDPAGDRTGGEPLDERLRTIAFAIRHGLDVENELARFRQVLELSDVRGILSRRTYAEPRKLGFAASHAAEIARAQCELRVHRERRFAVRAAEGLISGSIDRLVLLVREGQVLAADVIDFKTDRVAGTAAVDDKVEFYRPQIAAYRAAVAGLYRLEPEQVAARLVFVENGDVRPIA